MRQLVVDVANPLFAIVVLLVFFSTFVGVIYWVYFRVPQEKHDRNARIPLEDTPVDPIESQEQKKEGSANE